jgi:CRISPR/Cas system-associated exonuclease Cas4 (RecB family)
MRKLSQTYQLDLPVESVLKVGLLHDIGKIGDLDNELFIEQDSEWHREKLGQMYKYNENIQKMSVSHRTLFLLQKFNISLTNDEWIAIQLAQGSHFEENRFYVGSEPSLAITLQQSKSIVIHKERHR